MIGLLVALFGQLFGQAMTAQAQRFTRGGKPLQSLPPMSAIPIQSGELRTETTPTAFATPSYCDSETLRQSATIRSLRFFDQRLGIAVGDHGTILITRDGGQSWSDSRSGVECRLRDAAWLDASRIVAVGGGFDTVTRISRGVILISGDAGQTWKRASDSDMPLLHHVDLENDDSIGRPRGRRSVSVSGESDSITGATRFQSHDGGRTWQALLGTTNLDRPSPDEAPVHSHTNRSQSGRSQSGAAPRHAIEQASQWHARTQSRAIIRASYRIDESTLVCAGDHGVILRTTDGGTSWTTVRGEDASSGLLVIAAGPDQIPWALLGREVLEKRLRANLLVGDVSEKSSGPIEQAAMQLGVAAIDNFDPSETIESIESVKRWIDLHQPPILVLDATMSPTTKTAILQHAVAGGTKRVVEYDRGGRGEMLLHDSAVLLGSGALAGDFEEDSRLLVADFESSTTTTAGNPWIAIETRYGGEARSAHGDSLGIGVRLSSSHRLPARKAMASRRRSQVIRGRLKQQAAIGELFKSDSRQTSAAAEEAFAKSLKLLLDQTSRIDQFRAAWSVSRRAAAGRFEVTAWQEIQERFPQSSAGRLAGLHAKARKHSLEWRHLRSLSSRFEASLQAHTQSPLQDSPLQPFAPLPQAAKELLPGQDGHATIVSPFQTEADLMAKASPNTTTSSGVVQASATLPLGSQRNPAATRNANRKTDDAVDLAWQMHPVRLMVEDASERSAKDPEPHDLQNNEGGEDVSNTARFPERSADVRRLADGRTEWATLLKDQSAQVTVARLTKTPPRLDGNLDEPMWNAADNPPASTRDSNQATIRFAWDDQFIYVAVQASVDCFKETPTDREIGRRDDDLTDADRMTLGFDLDQDLLTAMRLAWTHDGRTHDDLDGHADWNPTWYVATKRHGKQTVTEIAIELSAFGQTIRSGDSWFVECSSVSAGAPRPYALMPDPSTRVRIDFRTQ